MISQCAGPEVGRPLQAYIVEKHRELYLRRLPQLLMVVQALQRGSRNPFELDRVASQLAASVRERETRDAEYGRLAAEHGRLAAERDRLLLDRASLEAERDRLYEELSSWRERVGFMEGTRTWRMREWAIGLKRALKGHPLLPQERR
jgi:hypothetical protein